MRPPIAATVITIASRFAIIDILWWLFGEIVVRVVVVVVVVVVVEGEFQVTLMSDNEEML